MVSEQISLFGFQSLPMALAMIAVALFLPDDQLPGMFLSIAVHEGGHLMIARLLGAKELNLRFGTMGFLITYLPTSLSPIAKAMAAAAGPFAGLLFYNLLRYAPFPWAKEAAHLSFALAVLNLLPLRFLDGGVVVTGFLEAALEPQKAEGQPRKSHHLST